MSKVDDSLIVLLCGGTRGGVRERAEALGIDPDRAFAYIQRVRESTDGNPQQRRGTDGSRPPGAEAGDGGAEVSRMPTRECREAHQD